MLFPNLGLSQDFLEPEYGDMEFQRGFPPNAVLDWAEDSLNFMWIGTENGLFRFDGYQYLKIETCGTNDTMPDLIHTINCLLTSQNNDLWIGTFKNGLYHKPVWNTCIMPVDLADPKHPLHRAIIVEIEEDQNGRIWVVTNEYELFVYDPVSKNATQLFAHGEERCTGIVFDKKKSVMWLTTSTPQVICVDPVSFSIVNRYNLPFKEVPKYTVDIAKIQVDEDETLWVSGYNHGLFYLPDGASTWINYPIPHFTQTLNCFEVAPNHRIFVNMDDGTAFILSPKDKKDVCYPPNKLHFLFYRVYISKNKDYWVNTFPFGIGVYYFKAVNTRARQLHPGAGNMEKFSILSLTPKDSKTLWVGTDGMGSFTYNLESGNFTPITLGSRNPKVVKTIYNDRNGNTWFGHWNDGMTCYNAKTKTFKAYTNTKSGPYQLNGGNVWAFTEDFDGNLWVSCLHEGLIKFSNNGNTRQVYFASAERMPLPLTVLDLMCDSKGTIWAVFESHGVAYLKRGESEFTFIDSNKAGWKDIGCRCIFEDSKSNIWVGTFSGLVLWRPDGTTRTFTSKDGLIANDVQSILEDGNGRLWIGSTKGASRVVYRNGNLEETARIETLNENPNAHLAACIGANKNLYFGGLFGLLEIFSAPQTETAEKPQVMISNVKTNLNTKEPGDLNLLAQVQQYGVLRLPMGQQNVSIDFASSNFSNTNLTKYQYILENYNTNWTMLEEGERRASFSNLEPGAYTLRVKCQTYISDWSEEKKIVLIVSVPFWRSRWFITSLVVIIGLLIGALTLLRYRQTTSQIKKQLLESEKSKLELEKRLLADEVEESNVQLMAKSAEVAQKHEKLSEILNLLSNLNKGTEIENNRTLRQLHRRLESEMKSEEEWETFKIYFDKTNQNYSGELLKKYPQLTKSDIRMSLLIMLNLETKEIAEMLNISVLAVQKSRYRLKKRLLLGVDDDLYQFLHSFRST